MTADERSDAGGSVTQPPEVLDTAALAEGYLRYRAELRQDDQADDDEYIESPNERADSAVNHLLWYGPARRAWEVVLEILRRTPDADAEAERDPRFKWALGCIWLDEESRDLPREIVDRIVAASGGRIKPMRGG